MRSTILPILLLFAASAAADVVRLKDGRALEGTVVDEGSRYAVTDRDQKHVVKKTDVDGVESSRGFMDEYGDRLAKLPTDDAEAIFEFGRWLEQNEWPARARRAYEEVLELDPEHRGARRALGYRLFEGAWLSPDEIQRRNGLVEFEGRWYTPHDLAELKSEIERNAEMKARREQAQKLNTRVNQLVKGFATFDKKQRETTHGELMRVAEQANSPELRKFADDAKAYYDYMAKVLCAKMLARTEIHATHTKLKKPIDVFETTLGAAIGPFAAQTPVKIQLPEISIAEVHSTVDVPAGCR